ncbi:hypothetical protein NHX12_034333, partial [Muraenolepis orangiensis]
MSATSGTRLTADPNTLQVTGPKSYGSTQTPAEKCEQSFFYFYYYRMEDEAVLDRGASFVKHVCDEEEVEGGELVFTESRYSADKKERPNADNPSDKSDNENNDEASSRSILRPLISPAAERIRFILGEEDDGPPPPQLFTELDELLSVDGQEMEWKETASLMELRTCIEKGTIMLDMEASTLSQVVEMITDNQVANNLLKAELKDKVTYTLLRKHRHQTKKSNLRSLADIGKTVSTASSPTTTHRNMNSSSMNDISDKPEKDQLKNKFMKKLPRDAEASNVLVGEVDFLDAPFVAFVRLQQAVMLGALTEVPVPT